MGWFSSVKEEMYAMSTTVAAGLVPKDDRQKAMKRAEAFGPCVNVLRSSHRTNHTSYH